MAKALMTPDAEQLKQKIEGNYAEIVQTVQAEDIMDRFVDEGYLSISDVVEKIMAEKTNQQEMIMLIKLLNEYKWKCGIFDFFLKQLSENGREDLARKIKETEKKPVQVSEGRADNHRYPEIPEKLKSRVVTEQHALFLSKTFSPKKVIPFGFILCFNEAEISHIKADYQKYGVSTVVFQLIIKWKNKTGFSATLGKLLEIFEKSSNDIELDTAAYEEALEKILRT